MAGDDLGYGGDGYGAGRFMQGDSLFSQPGLMPWNYQAPQFQAPVPPILQSPAPQAAPAPASTPAMNPITQWWADRGSPYTDFRQAHPGWNMGDNDIRRYFNR